MEERALSDSKAEVSIHSVIVAASEQISSELGGEAVILDLKSGVYYGLDMVGARIWSEIQVARSVTEIRDLLLSEYEVAPDRCERELLVLLNQLAENDLITISNAKDS